MPAKAQHPFTLTTQAQHDAHSGEALYWIESKGATGFYMIPMDTGNDAGVSTSNMPNERMLWYFMDAGIENTTQYYYIVNKSTGRFLRLKGSNGSDNSIGIKTYASEDDSYKFSVSGSTGQWVFSPKSGSNYYVNKKGTSVNYTSGLKSSTTLDNGSKWNFVSENSVTWAHPFTNSTSEEKHYYLIRNRHSSYTSYYMSTDASGYVTVSNEANNNRIWYFVEASTDASIPNMKYYYIVNAVTGNYMYFDGTINGISSLSDVFKIQAHSGGDDDRYQFAVLNAVGTGYSAYAIMPKKLISLYQNKYTSLGASTMNNGQHIGTLKDRDSNENTAHWLLVENVLFDPEISCDGEYITITCATEGASIYYRLNQTGDFSLYSSPIVFNATTTVEAYSSKNDNTSIIVTNTFEKYDNPFDESTRSLDSWTYGSTQVTLPYSVNCIDGHSSNYSKGTFTFETSINIYKIQPTYLWFQHADQSADIYVDNAFVTTHWGGYNAFFVDISDYVHLGTNRITVVLNNTTRNVLAPAAGDFNFNATLGKAKLLTSPVMPSMDYGYDGFHITATDVSSSAATLNIKTKVPLGATLKCKIDDEDSNYHYSSEQPSTGEVQTFTTTIENPILWNGTINPHLYTVTLEIYKDDNLYHRFQRDYGIRFFEYVIDNDVPENSRFMLNGSPYLLRGVCMHDDLEGKANALNDDDYAQEFAIIQDLGCNFIRLAHYPHPKEVYDWCDRLGIIVQTEVPCVNNLKSTTPQDYYDHLYIQYEDMVRQHYNHPCIVFWGLSNETTTDDKEFGKTKIEAYTSFIKGIDSERLVGYVMSHSYNDPSGYYNNPNNVDWFGCNIYVGWYIDKTSNNPTSQLNTRLTNTLTQKSKPLAFSEYGCGGTQHCHSDNPQETTTKGNYARHDIEYQMWLHEGHIAAIKNFPELLFTSQWQLFDIAVSSRKEGYTICLDGINTSTDDNLKYLNNKGLVERDHKTKKDTYYLYKAWWNQKDKFVHICCKDYEKMTGRVIKCYTNDGIITNDVSTLTLYVNNVAVETVTVEDNIATFTARDFNSGDVIRVNGANSYDAFTFTNDFISEGNWDEAANWRGNAVPADGDDVVIRAACTIPDGGIVQANSITIGENGSLTIADGGQLVTNSTVNATVEKNIAAYTIIQNQGEVLSDGWYFIASPVNTTSYSTAMTTGSGEDYDLFMLDWANNKWLNKKVEANSAAFGDGFTRGKGYLYANKNIHTLSLAGEIQPLSNSNNATVSLTANGWNLIGNPLTCKVTVDCDFSELNGGFAVTNKTFGSTINPCQGIAVYGNAGDVVTFTKADLQNAVAPNNSALQITLAKEITSRGEVSNKVVDNAVVNFNASKGMPKFNMLGGHAKLFIPQDNEEFAIVFSDRKGDLPLNFKADNVGTYTISFEDNEIDLTGIYLIDILAEEEIDLSVNPSYTFIGSPADRTARFKIVFRNVDGDSNDEIFAYQNGSDIIVSGEGELQIFDVMGRLVAEQYVNGVETMFTSSLPTGVYILRLNEKSQKIVIR